MAASDWENWKKRLGDWSKRLGYGAAIASLPPIALLYVCGLSWVYDQLPQVVHTRILLCIRWAGKALPTVLQPGVTWPLAIVAVLWIFRSPISAFLRDVIHLEAFGTKFSRKAELDAVAEIPPGQLKPAPRPRPSSPNEPATSVYTDEKGVPEPGLKKT